jgi:CubicO group peptidase (beta-lactamase class C family)
LLLIQDDRLVLEEYFHGFRSNDLHAIASCTKSVASLLIGIALDQGLIGSVDAPVLDFFPAYRRGAAKGWESVRLIHLLTMTAGLGWPENEFMPGRGADPGFSGNGPEGFSRLFAREIAHEPGTQWDYANPDVNLLSGVIYRATGLHADAFAAKHLFTPLGITDFDWTTYGKIEGYPNLAGSLRLRPRDMAKIGALMLADGRWQGERVLPADWIHASRTPQADTGDEVEDYGYLWWLMNLPGGKQIIAARGWGSQFIFIDPGHQRVIVTTGGNDTNGKTFAITRVLARYLYPEALEDED